MSFMHFDAHTAAAGEPVITLSGALGVPNTVFSVDGTNDGNWVGTAQATWLVAGRTFPPFDKGDMMRGDNDFGSPTFWSTPKEAEWNSDKEFTQLYWVRARHDPEATGDGLWGDPPNVGSPLDDWIPVVPDVINVSWGWACSSKFSCMYSGTLEISIARNTGNVITSDHTSLNFNSNTITRSGGTSFVTQGFAADQLLRVTGSENAGENDTTWAEIVSVTSSVITTNVFWTTNANDTTAVLEKYGEPGGTILATGYYKGDARVET